MPKDAPPKYEWRKIEKPPQNVHQSLLSGGFSKSNLDTPKPIVDFENKFQSVWHAENKGLYSDKKVRCILIVHV